MRIDFLFKPTDAAPLAAFRILMGLLMTAEGFGAILTGWVRENYVDVPFTFHFIGHDWTQVLVGPQAYAVYVLLGVAGVAIALGYRYRVFTALYAVLWTAVYLGQKTSYNNHYYLLMLLAWLFLLTPMHHYRSLDVKQGRVPHSETVPYWAVWTYKMLLAVVYFYAAAAKLYPDWLSGKAVGTFLLGKCDYPVIGPVCTEPWLIYLISYGGIAFDFLVIPALWYRPTRKLAFAASIGFHLFNSLVFQIGIFPYMMLITTVLYFEPAHMRWLFFRNRPQELPAPAPAAMWPPRRIMVPLLTLFFATMVLLPLRQFYYPGTPHWSEEAHRLSWHMMLRSKYGSVYFEVTNPATGTVERVYPEAHLPMKMVQTMATRPDQIWQYAQHLKQQYEAAGTAGAQVRATANVSLNGRPYQPLIDPNVDLAAVPWNHIQRNPWILPHPALW